MYAVDATDPTKWKQCVLNPALKTLQSVIDWGTWVDSVNASNHVFTNVELSDVRPLQPIPSVAAVASKRVKNVCQLCGGKVFMTECFWNGKYCTAMFSSSDIHYIQYFQVEI